MLLEMKNICKSFSGVRVLDDVSFDLKAGEVHAITGENGAGKSTLVKILTGVYTRDSGEILINDVPCVFNNVHEALEQGVVIVHQELNMTKDLTVAQNIYLGKEPKKGKFFIDDHKMVEQTRELFNQLSVSIDPEAIIGTLSIGEQQMVEIAKALSIDAKIIVFDEPTAALSLKETDVLFGIIRDLVKRGIGVIYISHRMAEIGEITNRISVLRDGKYIATLDTSDSNEDQIVRLMVGRELTDNPKGQSSVNTDEVVLEVKNLSSKTGIRNASFKLYKGEVLGFSGLMGAGRTELARLIFGADMHTEGEIYVHGKKVEISNTSDAIELGIGYVSEDRRKSGVLVNDSIAENISINNLDNLKVKGPIPLLSDQKMHQQADYYRDKLQIRSTGSDQKVIKLSGGNQQKVSIAKWLARGSEILIMDEPTRGIDVGAKSEIYDLINQLIEEGKSIIMISSEMNEVLKMSDRILVMSEGRITKELEAKDANQEIIMKYAVSAREELVHEQN